MNVRLILVGFAFLGMTCSLLMPDEAAAWVTIESSAGSWPAYVFAASSDEPIIAVGNIVMPGPVHQVSYGPSNWVFLDDASTIGPWQNFEPYDTHLLLRRSDVVVDGGPITEWHDGSDPGGLNPPSPISCGAGSFGEGGNGMLLLKPGVQGTHLDVLQAIPADAGYSWGGPLNMTLRTVTTTYYASIWPWGLNGTVGCWVRSPEGSAQAPLYDFGNVRIGTTATKTVEWGQAGVTEEGPYCLPEFPELNAPFYPYGSVPGRYVFAPETHGKHTEQGVLYGIDSFGEWYLDTYVPLDFSGTGVGPEFSSDHTPGSLIEFGTLSVDSFFDVFVELANTTPDAELGLLTQLSVLASIENNDQNAFGLLGDTCFCLLVGEENSLGVRFDTSGLPPGDYTAEFVLRTDLGASLWDTDSGEAFVYTLHATVVPEPSTLASLLAVLLACGLLFARRMR
ncbi:MAG: PEP-CTERM sorting domain-containing protein [Pirellulales bacterium]|nr:PEP-CTERM sorting domain-containing protein [Pirellulales bacterium]